MSSSAETPQEMQDTNNSSGENEKSTHLEQEGVVGHEQKQDAVEHVDGACTADQVASQEAPSEVQSAMSKSSPPASAPDDKISVPHTDEPWAELADLRSEKLQWLQRTEQLMEENQRYAEESRQAREQNELMFAEKMKRLTDEHRETVRQNRCVVCVCVCFVCVCVCVCARVCVRVYGWMCT
jgi:hypothetical protein